MFLQLINLRIGISPNIVKHLMVSLCPGANLFRTRTNVEKIGENGDKNTLDPDQTHGDGEPV